MTPEEQAAQAAAAAATAASGTPATPDFSALLHNGKVFGKYNTAEDAVKGFWELNNYAADQAKLARELSARVGASPQPTNRSAISIAAEEALVKPDVLAAAIREVAEGLVNARFAPIENTLGARSRLSAELPGYQENETAVQAFLNSNPEINSLVSSLQASGSPESTLAGMRLAYREWQAAQPGVTKPTPAQIAGAALPGGTGTGGAAGAAAMTEQADTQRVLDAMQHVRQGGDQRVLFSELFGDMPMYPGSETLLNQ